MTTRQRLAVVDQQQGDARASTSISPGAARRTLDVFVAAVSLVVLWPLFILLAIAIKLDSKGPVIFRQLRVGQGMTSFTLYKFRSMVVGPKGSDLTSREDPRLTRVGRFMRAVSLDELPQLVNVLRGDMTLVGPRPETVGLASRYEPDCSVVFRYRPGLTGPVQVRLHDRDTLNGLDDGEASYLRDRVPFRCALDLEYLQHPSLPRTVAILGETLLYVVGRRLWKMARRALMGRDGSEGFMYRKPGSLKADDSGGGKP